jgi:hypothetical protein
MAFYVVWFVPMFLLSMFAFSLRAIEQVSSSNGVEIFTWLDYCFLSLATRHFFDAEVDGIERAF